MNTFGIDRRVWDRIMGSKIPTPQRLALAASLCPEILGEIGILYSYLSLAATESSALALECGTSPLTIRNALAEWAESLDDARYLLRMLTEWDQDLGVWCACAIADPALRYAPAVDGRARMAIKIAREYATSRTSRFLMKDVIKAQSGVMDVIMSSIPSVGEAYFPAYHAISMIANSRADHSEVVRSAAFVVNSATKLSVNPEGELKRLCTVVAGAIVSYPTGEMINASRGLSRSGLIAGAAGLLIGAGAMHLARRR